MATPASDLYDIIRFGIDDVRRTNIPVRRTDAELDLAMQAAIIGNPPIPLTPYFNSDGDMEFIEDIWTPTNQVGDYALFARFWARSVLGLLSANTSFAFQGTRAVPGFRRGVDMKRQDLQLMLYDWDNTGVVTVDTFTQAMLYCGIRLVNDIGRGP